MVRDLTERAPFNIGNDQLSLNPILLKILRLLQHVFIYVIVRHWWEAVFVQ